MRVLIQTVGSVMMMANAYRVFCESPELRAFVRGIKTRVLISANRVITYELPFRKGGWGGGSLIFSHIRRLGSFYFIFIFFWGGGSNFEYKYFLWGVQKNEYL